MEVGLIPLTITINNSLGSFGFHFLQLMPFKVIVPVPQRGHSFTSDHKMISTELQIMAASQAL